MHPLHRIEHPCTHIAVLRPGPSARVPFIVRAMRIRTGSEIKATSSARALPSRLAVRRCPWLRWLRCDDESAANLRVDVGLHSCCGYKLIGGTEPSALLTHGNDVLRPLLIYARELAQLSSISAIQVERLWRLWSINRRAHDGCAARRRRSH